MAYIPEKLLRASKLVEDNLKFRLAKLQSVAAAVVKVSSDLDATNGAARISVNVDLDGAGGGAARDVCLIRFIQWDATTPDKLDGIGLTQRVYAPSKAQVVIDVDDTFADSSEVLAKVLFELARLGFSIEVYSADAGAAAAPLWAHITGANLRYTMDSIEYPLTSTL